MKNSNGVVGGIEGVLLIVLALLLNGIALG